MRAALPTARAASSAARAALPAARAASPTAISANKAAAAVPASAPAAAVLTSTGAPPAIPWRGAFLFTARAQTTERTLAVFRGPMKQQQLHRQRH